jgi:tRNA modification GTPase
MNDWPQYIRDTIVAPATPPGKGGVGVVRISGDDAESVGRKLLGDLPKPRYASNRIFYDGASRPIDSGIALYFPAPASYTGESIIELQAHGGPIISNMLLEAALEFGARRAAPGEFSQRAFLNGKLDLAQAEAIADLIDSGTAQAVRAAHRSLTGVFSLAVFALIETVIQLRLHVEAAIDFPEEEIDFLSDQALLAKLATCEAAFTHLLEQATAGRILRDGLRFVIAGAPNVGKSSLLNFLSGQDAAIVTEVAGTTRDIIREQIDIEGLSVELIDTAGLRDNPGRIEAEGIRKAKAVMQTADAVLWVKDATASVSESLAQEFPPGLPVIVIRNKIDLCDNNAHQNDITNQTINLSAKTGIGIDVLKSAITAFAGYTDSGEGAFTARRRHVLALQEAFEHFSIGRAVLINDKAGEILAEELRMAQLSLSHITGDFSSDDLLGRIFSEFCIGK